jgi:Fe-Mn family superoxide dismutase
VATVRDAETNRIFNTWIDLHHLAVPAAAQVIFVVDLWEHAYLLDFAPSDRGKYVECILSNTDWSVVDKRCTVTRQ